MTMDNAGARLLRAREPYAFQRSRVQHNFFPRLPQPAIQPNQLMAQQKAYQQTAPPLMAEPFSQGQGRQKGPLPSQEAMQQAGLAPFFPTRTWEKGFYDWMSGVEGAAPWVGWLESKLPLLKQRFFGTEAGQQYQRRRTLTRRVAATWAEYLQAQTKPLFQEWWGQGEQARGERPQYFQAPIRTLR